MKSSSQIYGIWILDEISRLTLVQRTYSTKGLDEQLESTLYSTILSFSYNEQEEKNGYTILMGDKRIIYEKTRNLFFIIVVREDYNIMDAKRILSHLKVTFLRKYPIREYNWQADDSSQHFKSFENTIDEIIQHFGTTLVVTKVVLMGLDYAGKTTLGHAFADSKYHDYFPTKGLDILKFEYKNNLIRIWDLGGQRQFWKLWPKFTAEASGFIFVVDSTTERWSETNEAFEVSRILNLPFVVFANKQDLVDGVKSIEFIAERLNTPLKKIIAGSALLNEGVFRALDRLIEEIQGTDLEEKKEEEKAKELENITKIHEYGLHFLHDLEIQGWTGLNLILLKLRSLLGYTNMVILRSENSSADFQIIVCEGEDCELLKENNFSDRTGQGVLNHVLYQKEPLIISENVEDFKGIYIEELKDRLLSTVAIPIADKDNEWGICLAYSNEKGYPSQKHTELFLIFAQYLAMGFKYLVQTTKP